MSDTKNTGRTLKPHSPLLAKNDLIAQQNRQFFESKGIHVINVLSSPGSGKTTLIGKILSGWRDRHRAAVITGDLATENDADRLKQVVSQVVQINTGTACHLDARMIAEALEKIDFSGIRLLFIENVGNLVCPTMFDLGETRRMVVLSVTEGEDKPVKYPGLFGTAQIVVINKKDLAEYVEFDRDTALEGIRKTAPNATIFEVSAKTGSGMNALVTHVTGGIDPERS
jgi:hydrogenase nickel incorporation protein HypB